MRVELIDGSHRVVGGPVGDGDVANAFLSHLEVRAFSALTVRSYAFHLLSFLRFCVERGLTFATVRPTDILDFLDWLSSPKPSPATVVGLHSGGGAAPSTMNQRVAAVRGMFEYAVISGVRDDCPVPTARRSSGARTKRRGLLGHISTGRSRSGGRLVREPSLLPESLDAADVDEFFADLFTYRDRAVVLLMLLGGFRAGEVRALKLADIDVGLREAKVMGKGGRERVVPIHRSFFVELTNYLRHERTDDCRTAECFVVLRGPTRGQAMTEAGMRKIFRTHRERSGAVRVRPHRLRHTYGTDLAASGIDLLVLRELMGHASPDTTAGYVHVSSARIAAEYAKAMNR